MIERAGYYIVKDTESGISDTKMGDSEGNDGKGRRFARFYNNGYRTKTPEGLEFVYQNTIGDRVRREPSFCVTV